MGIFSCGLGGDCCGDDYDTVFAYTTGRYAVIRDKRVGLVKYGLMLCIVSYIFLFEILYKCSYLQRDSPVGVVRFTLRQPTYPVGCNPLNGVDADCSDNVTLPSNFEYCNQDGSTASCSGISETYTATDSSTCLQRLGCETVQERSASCPANSTFNFLPGDCERIWSNDEPGAVSYYIADIEKFTIMIDHSITGTAQNLVNVNKPSREMKGRLAVPDNNELCRSSPNAFSKEYGWDANDGRTDSAPCYIASATTIDIFTLGTILGSANLALDTSNGRVNSDRTPELPTVFESYRYSGAVLTLSIEYKNWKNWVGTQDTIEYVLRATVVNDANYKFVEGQPLSYVDNQVRQRVAFKRYGVAISALQKGEIGEFNFQYFLLTLTTSLTLLAISTTVTDFVATKLLPDRADYYAAKFEKTEDFSDLRDRRKKEQRQIAVASGGGTSVVEMGKTVGEDASI